MKKLKITTVAAIAVYAMLAVVLSGCENKPENYRIKAEAEAELKAQREVTAKIEAELKAKREAEAKSAAEAKAAEAKAAAEAKKLAAAPIKKQLLAWVDSFSIPEANIESEKVAMIKSKFEAFKAWANQEANKL